METTTVLHIDKIEYRITESNKDEQKLIKKLEELIKKYMIFLIIKLSKNKKRKESYTCTIL